MNDATTFLGPESNELRVLSRNVARSERWPSLGPERQTAFVFDPLGATTSPVFDIQKRKTRLRNEHGSKWWTRPGRLTGECMPKEDRDNCPDPD